MSDLVTRYRVQAAEHADSAAELARALLADPHNPEIWENLRMHASQRDMLRNQANATDPAHLWVRPRQRTWSD